MQKKEIKKEAKKKGISITSIKNKKNGIEVKYYIFNEKSNYRTESRKVLFFSEQDIIDWIKEY